MLKCVASILLLLALSGGAFADRIYIDSVHVLSQTEQDNAHFALEFSEPPAWENVSFQFKIVGDSELRQPWKFDSIIDSWTLSEEDKVVLLSVSQYMWGGWTAKSDVVVVGNWVSFDFPLSSVSQHHVGGLFDYVVEAYFNGTTVSRIEHESVLHLPEPHPIALTIIGMLFIVVVCYGRDAT